MLLVVLLLILVVSTASFVPSPSKTYRLTAHAMTTTTTFVTDEEVKYTETLSRGAAERSPLTDKELDRVMKSLESIQAISQDASADDVRTFLKSTAHLSHKDWDRTAANAEKLADLLGCTEMSHHARKWLHRVVEEGRWDSATRHKDDDKPYAVLVTGLNGIRKTTALYEQWFPDLLKECLESSQDRKDIPTGRNSFFRQLDHMIATLCHEEFNALYRWMGQQKCSVEDQIPLYTQRKAAIFSRYRTLSEILGIALVRASQKEMKNVLLETSGRDIAMFHYVDRFFEHSRKLALHFQINDLSFAQQSVDRRMIEELTSGKEANSITEVIHANQGGPYGSEVLAGIQQASTRVWSDISKDDLLGKDWMRATIRINAKVDEPWTAQAVRPDGSLGQPYEFSPRP